MVTTINKSDRGCWLPFSVFIRPSSDGTYYGMVMSVRVSVRVSVRPSVHPVSVRPVSVRPFSALFSYMLWHIEFECHYITSIFEGVMPLCELRIWEIHSFPHFSPTCFDILSWTFAHDFVLMYYRASSSVISLRQFLKDLCLFWNLEYRKYTVFRSFLLHDLTYWAEILHMILF